MAGELTFGSSLSGFGDNPVNFDTNQFSGFGNSVLGNNGIAPKLDFGGLDKFGINPLELNLDPSQQNNSFLSKLFDDKEGNFNFDRLSKFGNFGVGLANTLLGFGQLGAIKQNNKFNQDLTSTQLLSNAKLTQERLDTRNKSRKLRDITDGTNFGKDQSTDILSGIQKFSTANS